MAEDGGVDQAGFEAAGGAKFTLSCREARNRKSQGRGRWRNIAGELEEEFWPEVQPSFRLKAGDTVFTIGSCFARNIEKNLAALGCKVPMLGLRLPPEEFAGMPTSAMNKFHPPAFRQSLEWTARIFDRDGVVTWDDCRPMAFEQDDGRFLDLDLCAEPVAKARFIARRQDIYDICRTAFLADCLMMTPGLIEAWRDLETDLYTFGAPTGREALAQQDRWRLEVLSYQDCLEAMLAAIDVVRARNPAVKILVTTSPVPLSRTFSGRDIGVANALSKAVLRAVCDAVTLEREGIDYFPSYEMATLSNPSRVWMADRVHVSPGFVAKIVGHMLDHYIEGVDAAAAAYQRARGLWLNQSYGEAETAAREALQVRPDHLEARLLLGVILRTQRRWEEAEEALRAAAKADPERTDVGVQLACAIAGGGKVAEAVALLDDALGRETISLHDFLACEAVLGRAPADDAARLSERAVKLFPLHVWVHEHLTKALVRAGRKPEAITALKRAVALPRPPPAMLLQLARLLVETDEREEALAHVQTALGLDPRNKEALSLREALLAGAAA